MWPVIKSSALIGWIILSSLNAVISTNERNRTYNRSQCSIPIIGWNYSIQTRENISTNESAWIYNRSHGL